MRTGHRSLTGRHIVGSRQSTVWRVVATVLASLTVFTVVLANTVASRAEAAIDIVSEADLDGLLDPDRPAAPQNPSDASAGQAVNILLIGVDDRSGVNESIGGATEGVRADATLLLHISADRTRVELISFPRDLMLDLSACERSDGSTQGAGFGRFNEAFSRGYQGTQSFIDGAACTWRTVEMNTGITINHFAVIDFAGFVNMVDAIEGVPMCIPVEYHDANSNTYLQAGPQVLNGAQSIAYVRMRKGTNVSGSDLDRVKRQQEFLKNLASKLISADMLYRPQDMTEFVIAVAESLTMNQDLADLSYVAGLGFSLRNLDPGSGIVVATAPLEAYPEDPKNKVQLSAKAQAIWNAIIADQPIAPLLDQQSGSDINVPQITAAPALTPAPGSPTAGEATLEPAEPEVDPYSEEGILASCAVN